MKTQLVQNKIVVKLSLIHGYGVFADKNIATGEIIEECPVLLTSQEDPKLNNYEFYATDEKYAIPLGFGCIYNHADVPNVHFEYDSETHLLTFTALRRIRAGEELLIFYGENWFDGRKLPIKTIPPFRRFWRAFSGFPLRALIACVGVFLLAHGLTILFHWLAAAQLS